MVANDSSQAFLSHCLSHSKSVWPDLVGDFSGEQFARSRPEERVSRSGDLSGDFFGERSSELRASV